MKQHFLHSPTITFYPAHKTSSHTDATSVGQGRGSKSTRWRDPFQRRTSARQRYWQKLLRSYSGSSCDQRCSAALSVQACIYWPTHRKRIAHYFRSSRCKTYQNIKRTNMQPATSLSAKNTTCQEIFTQPTKLCDVWQQIQQLSPLLQILKVTLVQAPQKEFLTTDGDQTLVMFLFSGWYSDCGTLCLDCCVTLASTLLALDILWRHFFSQSTSA